MSPVVWALLAGAVALLALMALALLWHAWRSALAHARALEQGRLVESEIPAVPGLGGVARSLNATVQRLRRVLADQAEQVALLQRQAQLDAVSGLPLRAHFLGQLQRRLAEPGGPGAALLLVRVLHLETLNPRLGHEATDRLLAAVGDVLLTYVDRVPGTLAGRLNGSDFALCLPVSGVAAETAQSLRTALAASPALRSGGAEVLVAGADGLRHVDGGAALAAADAALARAETQAEGGAAHTHADALFGEPVVEMLAPPEPDPEHEGPSAGGARAWREQIGQALSQGRVELAEFSVMGRDGRELQLECPLRVQLLPGGEFQAAERWLGLARRSRLLPQVDLAALDLALQAIARDGRARAVHAAGASLAAPGFVADVTRRLAAAPQAARRLSIECVEGLRPADMLAPLAAAAAAWRPYGVHLGLEHAGASPQQLPALQATGISYVKVDARHLRGVADDAAVRGYAQSLVALIRGLGLATLAEGIADEADLAAVWELGFDGATGPAVSLHAPMPAL